MSPPEPDLLAATRISAAEKLLFLKELSVLCREHNIYIEGPSPEEDPALVRPLHALTDDQNAYWYSTKSGLHYVEGNPLTDDPDIRDGDTIV